MACTHAGPHCSLRLFHSHKHTLDGDSAWTLYESEIKFLNVSKVKNFKCVNFAIPAQVFSETESIGTIWVLSFDTENVGKPRLTQKWQGFESIPSWIWWSRYGSWPLKTHCCYFGWIKIFKYPGLQTFCLSTPLFHWSTSFGRVSAFSLLSVEFWYWICQPLSHTNIRTQLVASIS